MNPLFIGIEANDPKDLILFILETIHNELNMPPNKDYSNDKIPNNLSFDEVYDDYLKNYLNENKSIISREFYGLVNSMTTCSNCQVTTHNVQSYNILFFPLEEVRKFKGYYNNIVSVKDCFDYYEKNEIYPSFFCNHCTNYCQAYQFLKIIYAPRTLIINLNRGIGLQFNVNILLEETLNIEHYVFAYNSHFFYKLIGVICHLGSNDMGGHFIAYCRNINNEWYKYNDFSVTKITFNEIKDNGMPYVLFYSYEKKAENN